MGVSLKLRLHRYLLRIPRLAPFLHMTVLGRHGDTGVAQGLLYNLHIPGCLVEQGTAGMSQGMAGSPFLTGVITENGIHCTLVRIQTHNIR